MRISTLLYAVRARIACQASNAGRSWYGSERPAGRLALLLLWKTAGAILEAIRLLKIVARELARLVRAAPDQSKEVSKRCYMETLTLPNSEATKVAVPGLSLEPRPLVLLSTPGHDMIMIGDCRRGLVV
jgi:hypothetical protein